MKSVVSLAEATEIKENKKGIKGLPWWSGVKNPPANAADMGLIPGLVPQSN